MNRLNIGRFNPLRETDQKILVRSFVLLMVAAIWPAATAQAAVYGFNTLGPMTSTNGSGETIRVNGSGTFDDVRNLVHGSGSYSISDSDGKVIERGAWMATEFESFHSDGGLNNGLQGGDLDITITLFPNDGPPEEGVSMTLTCPFEDGVFDNPSCDMTVDDFVNPSGGIMVFHLLKP